VCQVGGLGAQHQRNQGCKRDHLRYTWNCKETGCSHTHSLSLSAPLDLAECRSAHFTSDPNSAGDHKEGQEPVFGCLLQGEGAHQHDGRRQDAARSSCCCYSSWCSQVSFGTRVLHAGKDSHVWWAAAVAAPSG
jgi:hypothetical protein